MISLADGGAKKLEQHVSFSIPDEDYLPEPSEEPEERPEVKKLFDINMMQNYEKAHVIDEHLDGRLRGKGRAYVSAGLLHNVNPFLLASISIHETGNGTSKILREKNNVAGLMKNGITFRKFESIDESIFWFASLLEKYYIAGGRNDLESIGAKFCPLGAKNDPTGLNKNWIPNIEAIYTRMVSDYNTQFKGVNDEKISS